MFLRYVIKVDIKKSSTWAIFQVWLCAFVVSRFSNYPYAVKVNKLDSYHFFDPPPPPDQARLIGIRQISSV